MSGVSTGQAGSVVIQVTADDFGRLWESSGPWGLGAPPGRFETLDGKQPPPRQWQRVYWFGPTWTTVIFARAFLDARGHDYEILFDTASDRLGGPMYGYVILTDYQGEEGQ